VIGGKSWKLEEEKKRGRGEGKKGEALASVAASFPRLSVSDPAYSEYPPRPKTWHFI
jgi:hypothetical protein